MSEEKYSIDEQTAAVEVALDAEPMVVDTTKSLKEMLMGDNDDTDE